MTRGLRIEFNGYLYNMHKEFPINFKGLPYLFRASLLHCITYTMTLEIALLNNDIIKRMYCIMVTVTIRRVRI